MDAQESIANAQVNHQNTSTNGPPNDLLRLARKQGMNSDIRRSIFVVLMSSDVRLSISNARIEDLNSFPQDYVDACERLSQLSLTEVQQREIVRVLLHCCGNVRSIPFSYNTFGSIKKIGENLQPILCTRVSTTLPSITFFQNHTTILPLGLLAWYGWSYSWRSRGGQECAGRRCWVRLGKDISLSNAQYGESLRMVDCEGCREFDYS